MLEHFDWSNDLMMLGRALLATVLGILIGWERERRGHEAGVRTYGAVALGACVFGLISWQVPNEPSPTRIASYVVSGIGFLGAGVILRDRGRVRGLTTAATLWTTSAVGLAVAFGLYFLAIASAGLAYFLLIVPRLLGYQATLRAQRGKEPSEEAGRVDE